MSSRRTGRYLLAFVTALSLGWWVQQRGLAQETAIALSPIPVSADTGEKPQSKVWFHEGSWWAVLPSTSPSPGGTWLWRLNADNTWTSVLQLSSSTTAKADAKAIGGVTHVLLYGAAATELASVEYVPASNTYQLWTARPSNTPIALPGSEIATIDVDSTGRLWLATESGTNINVYWSDAPYSAFSGPVNLATGISDDDIAVVTALPNGTVGVLWSNQTTQRFGFRAHIDGADPVVWSADEVPASQSALSVGLGMGDDHLNVAVASDSTLYAAVKTSYDTAGYPKIALLVRRPQGTWDNLYQVDLNGTRGIVLLDELRGLVRVVYSSSESGGDILYKESSTSAIDFSGPAATMMTGSPAALNNATSTKQNWTGRVVVLATGGGLAKGVLVSREDPALVGWWPMNEGAGPSARDYSGFGGAGVLQGNPLWMPGVSGTSIAFDGTDGVPDAVVVPHSSALSLSTGMTVSAWIKPGRAATQDLVTKGSDGTGYALSLSSTTAASPQRIFVRLNGPADTYRVNSSAVYPADGNTWVHAAATFDGTSIRLYINGIQDGSIAGPPTGIGTNSAPVYIGAHPTESARAFKGQLDDVRIYNRALSAAEIASIANVALERDLAITKTDGESSVTAGQALTYSIVAANNSAAGVTGATVADTLPASLTSATWTCVASAGSNCPASGTGNINALVNLAGGGTAAFTLHATVSAGASGTIANTASVTPPSGIADPVPSNNSATDTDTVFVAGPGITTGLAGYWKMEEGAGATLVDASGNGNNATAVGSPAWVTGKDGLALSLNGTSQYAAAPHSASLNITGAITMSAWAKPVVANATQNLVKKATGATASTGGYELSLSSVGKAFIRVADATAVYRVDSATPYPTNQWIHVAATYDGTMLRLYLNGVQDGTPITGPAALRSNTLPVGIGAQSDGALGKLQGQLDEVRIYNRALSASEISALASNIAPVVTAGSDQAVTLPATASLSGSVSDDALPNPPGAVTVQWTKVSGPGTVAFGTPGSPATTASFSTDGAYVLRLTANDGMLTSVDDVAVAVSPSGPVNLAPVVGAGADQLIALPSQAVLAGSASDDGQPSGSLTVTWSAVSGPAGVLFADSHSAATTATFALAGTYGLRLTATDGALTTVDDVTLTVSDPILVGAGDITPDCTAGASIANAQATAALLSSVPGTIFTLGDNAYQDGTAQQFAQCYGAAWGGVTLKPRTRPATGNHEYNANALKGTGNNANPYFDYFNGTGSTTGPAGDRDKGYYSYDVPNWHVVVLNSECGSPGLWETGGCAVGSAQEQWLRADLAASPTNNIIGMWHKPRFSSSASDSSIDFMQPLWQAMYEYGVDVVLGGHWHNYERLAPVNANGVLDTANGIRQFVVGTGGVPFSGFGTTRANSEVRQNTDHGVLKLTLHAGSYDWEFIPIAGRTFTDSGTAPVHGPPPPPSITSISPAVGPAAGGTLVTIAGTGFGAPSGTSVKFGAASATSSTCTSATLCTATAPAGVGTVDVTVTVGGQTSATTTADRFTYNQAPQVDAGVNQTITLPAGASLAGTVIDDGAPNPPGSVSVAWTMASGPGAVAFANAGAASTTATFSTAGTYVLRLTANDGMLANSDDITIVVNPGNQAPVVDAGANQTISLPATASLSGTATDDGLPSPPGALTLTWSKTSGPGTVTFGNPAVLSTTATFSLPGTYVLQLSASDGALTSSDAVTITARGLVGHWPMEEGSGSSLLDASGFGTDAALSGAPSWAPAIRGLGLTVNGTTQNGLVPHTARLNPATAITVAVWVKPAKAAFATQDLIKKAVTGTTNGYELSLAVGGKPFFRVNQVTSADTYRANAVTSYPLNSAAWQHLAATYDGSTINMYVNGALEASVPGPAAIAANTLNVGIGAQSDATRRFEGAMDDARIYDRALGAGEIRLLANRPPAANAGADQTVTLPAAAALSGAVTDDGIPSSSITASWTQISGPGVVTFSNPAAAATSASFSAAGTYVLQLSASDGDLAATDSLTIVVNPSGPVNQAPTVNAGVDQTITLPASALLAATVTDDGLPGSDVTTLWTMLSGPAAVVFSDATSTGTTATFSTAGSYVLRLTADDGALSSSDTLTVTVATAASNNALDLGGTNAYVNLGAAPGLRASTFTLELWFRRDGAGITTSTGSGGFVGVPLVSKGMAEGDGSAVDMNYFLGIRGGTDGVLGADFEDMATGANHPVSGTTVIPANGTWHHAAATYDGATWRLYLDGALDGSLAVGSFTPRSDSNQWSAIGSASNSTGGVGTQTRGLFDGAVDEVRIWNYARTPQQILETINQEVTSASGLLGRWSFNAGTGTAVADSSGSGITGTVVGSNFTWVAGAPFRVNQAPAPPALGAPSNGATGIATSPALSAGVTDPDGDPMAVTFFGRSVPAGGTPDFTIVALPDTQHYVDDPGRAATFTAQTQWIVDNKTARNIAFVTHLGDIAEHIDAQPVEWVRADSSLSLLEGGGLKWGLAPGNHDMSSAGLATNYDATFPVSRFSGNAWYGGYLGKDPINDPVNRENKDNYELFSVGGLDFIILHLEYDMPGYSVDWANRILAQYPNRRAIISTHLFLSASGVRPTTVLNRTDGTPAETVWQQLIRSNCNVFLVLNGHYPGEANRTDLNACGQPVHQLASDYQSRTNGGDGWLRYLVFAPAANKIYVYTFSPTLNGGAGQFETDANSQFVLDYDMQGTPFTVIATNSGVASGTNATATWPGLPAGAQFEWYVTANDGAATTTSPIWTFSTAQPNRAPSVTNPGDQTSAEGQSVSVAVTASDADGDALTYSATGLPAGLSMDAAGVISGSVAFGATASNTVVITVTDGSLSDTASFTWTVTRTNRAPELAAIGNQSATEGTLLTIALSATDPDGDALTYSATGLPAGALFDAAARTFTWTPGFDQSGPHAVTFAVTDGVVVDSEAITITVANTNRAPSVTNPGDQTSAEGQSVSVAVTASDADGDALTYSATGLPAGLSISGTGVISGTVAVGAASTNNVTVTAADGALSNSASFIWTVTPTAVVPSLTINDATVTEGNTGTLNATFAITLSGASSLPVTVGYATANGTATAGADYNALSPGTLTFAPGETAKTLVVPVRGDTVDEDAETFLVNLSSPANATLARAQGIGTITDNDAAPSLRIGDVSVVEGDGGTIAASFNVTLSAVSERPVSVNYATASKTASAGIDFVAQSGSLAFAPGVTVQTITVLVQGDTLPEANETFAVNLSGAVNAGVGDAVGLGTIVNDDAMPSVTIDNVIVTEGGKATFTITLSRATGTKVTVRYTTANGTALAGSDYLAKDATISLTPGTVSKTISITTYRDAVLDPDETFFVNLSAPVNAILGEPQQGTATIRNR